MADARVYVHAEDRSLAEVRMLHALDGGRVPFVRVVEGRIVYAAYSTDEAGFFEAWIEREGRFRVGIVGEAYRTMVSDPYRPAESYVQSFGEPFALERRVQANRPSQNPLTFPPSAGICFLAAEDTIRVLEEPRLFSPVARVLDTGQRVTFIGPRGSLDDSPWLRVSWTQEGELRSGWIAPRLASYSTSCIGPTD